MALVWCLRLAWSEACVVLVVCGRALPQELYKKLKEMERTRKDMEAASQALVAAAWGGGGRGSASGAGAGAGAGPGAGAEAVTKALSTLEALQPLVGGAV